MSSIQETEDLKDRLDTAQAAITTMYEEGAFGTDAYFSALLTIAEEWVENEGLQEARDIVQLMDEDYLTIRLPKLMRDDPDFHEKVHKIAIALAPATREVGEADIDLALLKGPIAKV